MFGTIRIIKQNQPQKQAKQGSPQTTPACPGRTSSHHHNHVHWRAQPRNLMRVLWLALTCGGVGIALGAFWNAIGTCHVQ